MNLRYIFWFLMRGIVSYPIFYIGLTFIQIFIMFFYDIKDVLGNYKILLFVILFIIGFIYCFMFYTRDSKKIGIIMIYGGNILTGFIIPFSETLVFLILSVIIILVTIGQINVEAILINLAFIIVTSIIIALRFLLIDIYKIIKEN